MFSKKMNFNKYKGAIVGFIISVILILLSYLRVIDTLEGFFLIFGSFSFVFGILIIEKLSLITDNEILANIIYYLLYFIYFGFLGEIVFRFNKNKKNRMYLIIVIIFLMVNFVTYYYAKNWLNSLDRNLGYIINRLLKEFKK